MQWREVDGVQAINSTRSSATYAAVEGARDEIVSMKDLRVIVDK